MLRISTRVTPSAISREGHSRLQNRVIAGAQRLNLLLPHAHADLMCGCSGLPYDTPNAACGWSSSQTVQHQSGPEECQDNSAASVALARRAVANISRRSSSLRLAATKHKS